MAKNGETLILIPEGQKIPDGYVLVKGREQYEEFDILRAACEGNLDLLTKFIKHELPELEGDFAHILRLAIGRAAFLKQEEDAKTLISSQQMDLDDLLKKWESELSGEDSDSLGECSHQ